MHITYFLRNGNKRDVYATVETDYDPQVWLVSACDSAKDTADFADNRYVINGACIETCFQDDPIENILGDMIEVPTIDLDLAIAIGIDIQRYVIPALA